MRSPVRLKFVDFLNKNTQLSANISIMKDSITKGITITALKLALPPENVF